MYNIDVQVRNKIAKLQITSVVYGVCNNSDYVVNFDFDEEWNDYSTKTMQINYGSNSVLVVFAGTQCAMPIISEPGAVEIGVFAGDLHTTTGANIPYIKSINTTTGLPPDPLPDVYTQIIDLINSNHMRSDGEHIQYSLDQVTWYDVVALDDLKGPKGDKGDPGEKGEKGDKGDTGDCNFATFEIDPTTGILSVNYTTDDSDITFNINTNNHLEVMIR